MCLIIEKRRCDTIPQALIESAWDRNHDGYGIMYRLNGRVIIHKGNKRKHLFHDLNQIRDKEAYIHLRMATHGRKNIENTHPFDCGRGVFLMHNGIVDTDTSSDSDMSDTWHMVRQVFIPLLKGVTHPMTTLRAPWFLNLLEGYLGSTNRVVLMTKHGSVVCPSNNWYTIKNLDQCKGMRVSNTYGWNYFHLEGRFSLKETEDYNIDTPTRGWYHPYKELDNPYPIGIEGTKTANILKLPFNDVVVDSGANSAVNLLPVPIL